MSFILLVEQAAPEVPSTNQVVLYPKSDGLMYTKDDVGTERELQASSPTGSVIAFAGASAPTDWLLCDGSAVSRTTYAALFAIVSTTWGVGDGATTFNLPDLKDRVPIGAGTGTQTESGDDTDITPGDDTIVVTSNNTKWLTGMSVVLNISVGTITGLSDNTTYYVVRNSATTIKLASTLANAQNGTVVDITAVSADAEWDITHTYTTRTRGQYGGEESHAMSSTEQLLHTHVQNSHTHGHGGTSGVGGTFADLATGTRTDAPNPTSGTVATNQNTGGNAAMNVMQPFTVMNYIIKT